MWVWFKNISDAFEREVPPDRTVRRLLVLAADRAAPVGVGEVDPGACSSPKDGFIERVDAESLLIRCANDEPIPALLAEGARVQLSILTTSGFEQGEVTVLGEWASEESDIQRRGVRVTIPQALIHIQRRLRHRVTVAFDLSPRATLAAASPGLSPDQTLDCRSDDPAPTEPAVAPTLGAGDILDISETGLRVRLPNQTEQSEALLAGQIVALTARFPASFPSFDCRAEIMHGAAAVHGEGWILGLRFLEGHPDLSRAIHQLELRRAQRSVR